MTPARCTRLGLPTGGDDAEEAFRWALDAFMPDQPTLSIPGRRLAHALRVCVAVGARRDDFGVIARLQLAHAGVLALERVAVMVAAAAPVLERVAVAIEARTAVARASEERAAKEVITGLARELVAAHAAMCSTCGEEHDRPAPTPTPAPGLDLDAVERDVAHLDDDDSGPVPSLVDDADDGSH